MSILGVQPNNGNIHEILGCITNTVSDCISDTLGWYSSDFQNYETVIEYKGYSYELTMEINKGKYFYFREDTVLFSINIENDDSKELNKAVYQALEKKCGIVYEK